MALTPGQLVALRNLARKQAGDEVNWINIADARALTALGFAERNRGGWEITPAGLAAAQAEAPAAEPAEPINNVDPFIRP